MKIFVCSHKPSGPALELASPSDRSFRLWAAFQAEGEAVDPKLAGLLRSALGYPPALALARNDLDEVAADKYLAELAQRLGQHLAGQSSQGAFLAQAQRTTDELSQGRFYWIVGFDGESGLLEWVSDDFLTYEEQPDFFSLSPQDLGARFGQK